MYISYFDESGDDGNPGSSPIFVLTSIYMHYSDWKDNYEKLIKIRRELKAQYGFPVKLEFHTRELVLNKDPYRAFGWDDGTRKSILDYYVKSFTELKIKVINVSIIKSRIRHGNYGVLDEALKYNIQRIERDLDSCPDSRFIVITDEGRIGPMTQIARKMQKFNYIPSMFSGSPSYRKEINRMIEDPFQKDSKESYFIQMVDTISFIVYRYSLSEIAGQPCNWPNRMANVLGINEIKGWLEVMKDAGLINMRASSSGEHFGIVNYPKP